MSNLEAVAVKVLLTLADACAEARGVQLRTISRLCHGDPPALDRLKTGEGSITLRKYDESMCWLRDRTNWPPGSLMPRINEPWKRAAKEMSDARRDQKGRGG